MKPAPVYRKNHKIMLRLSFNVCLPSAFAAWLRDGFHKSTLWGSSYQYRSVFCPKEQTESGQRQRSSLHVTQMSYGGLIPSRMSFLSNTLRVWWVWGEKQWNIFSNWYCGHWRSLGLQRCRLLVLDSPGQLTNALDQNYNLTPSNLFLEAK